MTIWDEWKKEHEIKHRTQNVPAPKHGKGPVPTRPITEEELIKIKKLQHISSAWWCGDNRFIDQFREANLTTQLTERQAWYISVLWYKYRRQLGHNGTRPPGYE